MYNKLIDYCKINNVKYIENELMSEHTSFKIGGPCDLFITIYNIIDLKKVISICNEDGISFMLLGNGSNMLIHDEGIEGVVIKLQGAFEDITIDDNDNKLIHCGSAVLLEDLCIFARDNELTGLEFAYGIPGSVGGAAFMNAGAYGGEMKDVVVRVIYLDEDGNVKVYERNELNYGYRTSIFRSTKAVILSVDFSLDFGNVEEITEKMDELMTRRKDKQPLEYPSAGSVFKRPEGQYAGTLIQQCGLKGTSVGGAQVSEKHSGFIINKGGATCCDVLNLVKLVQETVQKETGFFLEREIIDLGR